MSDHAKGKHLFNFLPSLWTWFHNRRHSRSRKQLCKWFPNLR